MAWGTTSSDALAPGAVAAFLDGPANEALRAFIARQRWFAAKARGIARAQVRDWALVGADPRLVLLLLDVDGEAYFVPVAAGAPGAPAPASADLAIATLAGRPLGDGFVSPDLARRLVAAIAGGQALPGTAGVFAARAVEGWRGPDADAAAALPVQRLGVEQSNTSVRIGAMLLKVLRRPHCGIDPDLEVAQFLTTRTGFAHTPELLGWLEYVDAGGDGMALAMLQAFVDNRGDGWTYTLRHLAALLDALAGEPAVPSGPAAELKMRSLAGGFLDEMRQLGTITGELHAALGSDSGLDAFRPEPITAEDVTRWRRRIVADAARMAEAARPRQLGDLEKTLGALGEGEPAFARIVGALDLLADGGTYKIRCHGDYHLGQLLKTAETFLVIDFEGEPARGAGERRGKHSPLRDVAGMLRSFDYAVEAVRRSRAAAAGGPDAAWLAVWQRLVAEEFLGGYLGAVRRGAVRCVPARDDAAGRVCAAFELEKALYELYYELTHRPDWAAIPLGGIRRLLEGAAGRAGDLGEPGREDG